MAKITKTQALEMTIQRTESIYVDGVPSNQTVFCVYDEAQNHSYEWISETYALPVDKDNMTDEEKLDLKNTVIEYLKTQERHIKVPVTTYEPIPYAKNKKVNKL